MRYGLMSELARTVSRFAMVGAIGSVAAACSSDAMRLSGSPFANPFASEQSAEPMATASVDAPVAAAPMPRSSVRSAPLAPPAQKVASAPVYNRPASVEGANPSVAGLNPAASTQARTTAPAKVAAAPAPATRPEQGRIVSRSPLAQAKPAPVATVPERAPARPAQLAWKPGAEPARVAQAPEPKAHVRPGQKVAVAPEKAAPVKEPVKVAKAEKPAEAAKPAKIAAAPVKPEPVKVAKPEPAKVVPAQQPKAPEPVKVAAKAAPAPQKVAAVETAKPAPEPARPAKEPESTASLPAQPAAPSAEFRWPARGRVISGFGGAGSNEGINIAVPDGTPVKAAEGGTVAYAGSEVKGYGNLVLIRHDNGYVSAYAHNGEIEVKRGQKVNRGQTIAKSGQSGNVTSPQLHFEIRKGSQPVDPMQYLASN